MSIGRERGAPCCAAAGMVCQLLSTHLQTPSRKCCGVDLQHTLGSCRRVLVTILPVLVSRMNTRRSLQQETSLSRGDM